MKSCLIKQGNVQNLLLNERKDITKISYIMLRYAKLLELYQKHISQLSIGLRNEKIPIAPPIFLNKKLMSDFQRKLS